MLSSTELRQRRAEVSFVRSSSRSISVWLTGCVLFDSRARTFAHVRIRHGSRLFLVLKLAGDEQISLFLTSREKISKRTGLLID